MTIRHTIWRKTVNEPSNVLSMKPNPQELRYDEKSAFFFFS